MGKHLLRSVLVGVGPGSEKNRAGSASRRMGLFQAAGDACGAEPDLVNHTCHHRIEDAHLIAE